jgi:hypothetical protein
MDTEHALILEAPSDPVVVAATPGVYVAPSSSPSYGVLLGVVEAGAAQFLGETYLADGRLAVIVAVGDVQRNVAGQISIGSEFFVSALRDYGDWQEKWWREAIQNAVDAGADEVDCVVTMLDEQERPTTDRDAARTVQVSCQDNGKGMDEDTLVNRFLVLGGTTKYTAETVGGFGKAKELLLLPWLRWHLHSRDMMVEGHGIQYDIRHVPGGRTGTGITVWMPMDRYTRSYDAISFLKKCAIPGVTFTVNGDTVRADQRVGKMVDELPGKIQIFYKKTSKDFSSPTCLVRVKGVYMFERYVPSDLKGVVIVEVTGSSVEMLTANRDGIRDSYARRALDDYMNRLAADVKTATKGARNVVQKKFRGSGKFRAAEPVEQRQARVLMELGSTEPADPGGGRPRVLTQEQTDVLLRAVTEFQPTPGEQEDTTAGIDLRPNAELVRAMLDVPMVGSAHVEAVAKQLMWEPDFYVYNEIEDFHVPASLMPEKMTPQVQKLARFWAELCRFTLIQLGSRERYGVGWHFDTDEDAAMASYIRDGDEHWLMLNPYVKGDYVKREMYSLSNRDHVNWLYAAAVHECTHMADAISRHNEAFASAFTENVARTANRGRQIEAIRKAVVARGARIGKLGELEAPGAGRERRPQRQPTEPSEGELTLDDLERIAKEQRFTEHSYLPIDAAAPVAAAFVLAKARGDLDTAIGMTRAQIMQLRESGDKNGPWPDALSELIRIRHERGGRTGSGALAELRALGKVADEYGADHARHVHEAAAKALGWGAATGEPWGPDGAAHQAEMWASEYAESADRWKAEQDALLADLYLQAAQMLRKIDMQIKEERHAAVANRGAVV